MFLFLHMLLLNSVVLNTKAVTEPHIEDFLKTPNVRNYQNVQQNPPSNDSHAFMNYRSMIRRLSTSSREEAIQHEIELGHTGRKEFVPLVDQRNKHERRVSGALIAGVLLGKEKPLLGQPLKKYAQEQRTKSQGIQRQMDVIKAAGHVDPELEKKDLGELIHANYIFGHEELPPDERQKAVKQRKSVKKREDVKRHKDTQHPDAKRRYNERRKAMKRTRKG